MVLSAQETSASAYKPRVASGSGRYQKPFGCEPEMHTALDPLSFANNRSITITRANLQKPISCEVFFGVCRVGFSMSRLANLVCRDVL